jgi:uncharacterized protein (TIGR00156 family)
MMNLRKQPKGKNMKKISISVLSAVLMCGSAFADFEEVVVVEQVANPSGGFVAGEETIVTVKQVNEMRDDVPVIVKGRILQRIGNEKYLFEDNTGSITVEIDNEDWRGQTVAPTDTVKLYGEVDRGIFKTQIDVDYVEKM